MSRVKPCHTMVSGNRNNWMTGPPKPLTHAPVSRHEPRMLIYKILRRAEWDALKSAGTTLGAPIDLADGFVHFSGPSQVAETAAKYFADISDLVLVACDDARLGPALKWEASRGGALFPHLYRALTMDDVVWDKSLPLGLSGHIFPEGVI